MNNKEVQLAKTLKELVRFGDHIEIAKKYLASASNVAVNDEMSEYLDDLHDKLTDMMFEVSEKRIEWTKNILGGGFDHEYNGVTLDNAGELRGA